ncbi:hypothetical protein GW17_00050097 [Ensete ventricosum]|nr:hypothetical protein GW17_00050097 [Ensete ventricosum]
MWVGHPPTSRITTTWRDRIQRFRTTHIYPSHQRLIASRKSNGRRTSSVELRFECVSAYCVTLSLSRSCNDLIPHPTCTSIAGSGSCTLVRPRSCRRRVGARVGGKGSRARLERSVVRVVELRSGGDVSARVRRWFLQEGRVGSRRDPSDGQVSLVVDFAILPLRRGVWAFIVMVTRHSYLRSLLRLLLAMSSYFVVASVVLTVRCATCLLPLGKVGLAPTYLCQVDRMTADPPMLVSGRAQSRRVDHVVGPAVRGHRDVAVRSTFVISFSPPPRRPSRGS